MLFIVLSTKLPTIPHQNYHYYAKHYDNRHQPQYRPYATEKPRSRCRITRQFFLVELLLAITAATVVVDPVNCVPNL
jgi:hypothetical protein